MSKPAYPDYRTPGERERERKREAAEQKRRDANAAAERRAELERIERLRAAGTQTPETYPDAFRRIELDVHVAFIPGDLDVMMRTMKRIVDAKRAAKDEGDAQALREADEEGTFLAEIMKRYLLVHMDEEERRGGTGQFEETRKVVRNAARKNALRTLREAS